ncbi:thermonuclease family protein [Candidatus Daviesbacteria bacterium]|nr:thermonuclease family protein [Candidatus Daviesbacteria bacterium]
MFDNRQKVLLGTSLLILLLSGYLFWKGLTSFTSQPTSSLAPQQTLGENTPASPSDGQEQAEYRVTKVIDGDTIEIDDSGQPKKLRYIGVNTPETVDPRKAVECFGKEASNENKRLIEGQKVILEKDVSETDRFDRFLRYVFLKLDDGSLLFINDYLVRQGFAYASTYPPDVKYQEKFAEAEKEARDNNRGLWSKCQRS